MASESTQLNTPNALSDCVFSARTRFMNVYLSANFIREVAAAVVVVVVVVAVAAVVVKRASVSNMQSSNIYIITISLFYYLHGFMGLKK
jgi:hypothetical protein